MKYSCLLGMFSQPYDLNIYSAITGAGVRADQPSYQQAVFSTTIGPAPTRLGSHWSSSNEAWLSLVESFRVLLCQQSYALKNQLVAFKGP